ncbi:MAG: AAA family ATPase [Candidatus Hermodarchaeia archaeon]
MYASFFGFRENPFNLTPDPRYFFMSRYHKEALDHLLYGINERKGFIAITGRVGTGKTTLCRTLLSHLHASTKSALILNSFISDMELLKIVNQDFGIEMNQGATGRKDYIDALNHFLLKNFSHGGNAVLLIDEAQNLSLNVLEQIRMLSNLETEREKLIQIVLVGQSELKELLAASSLRQLNERIMVRYDLKPLDYGDTKRYVEHRLAVAGGQGNVRFTDGVFRKIYTYSKGNPRRINTVCDRVLHVAYLKGTHTVSKGMVGRAVEELRKHMGIESVLSDWSQKRVLSSALLLLLLIMVAGFAGWKLRGNILGISIRDQEAGVAKIVKPIDARSRAIEPKKRTKPHPPNDKQKRLQTESFELVILESRDTEPASRKEASVVELEPKGGTTVVRRNLGFSVQVGAFLVKENAEKLVGELVQKGYKPNTVEISDYDKKGWYSVRIGEYTDLKEASRAASEYKKQEGQPAIVTTVDSLYPVSSKK